MPSKMGAVCEVNTSDVICGNIQTANATVSIVSKVLIPCTDSARRGRRPVPA